MTVLLALAAAAVYGAGDFLGGLASRRAAALQVVALSHVAGFGALVALLPAVGGAQPTMSDLVWGGVAGLAGGLGVWLLYRGLAEGPMNVVAPLTAVCAGMLPLAAGLISGERPGPLPLVGVVLALVGIALVTREDTTTVTGDPPVKRAVALALGAGAMFGVFFVLVARSDPASGLWPLVAARVVSSAAACTLLLRARHGLRLPAATLRTVVGAGVLDTLANVLYLLAARRGLVSLVAVLTSLYPASTVLLARAVLGERMHRAQLTGVGVALAAVALMAT
jgi:drug/metabolite transporter (DMT)-like permease